jgi:nitrite reductase/ring-hydroxylating ferredoxin subunit
MPKHPICRASELPPGERRIVEVGKRSIGVFNVHGDFYAIRNLCPHQAAPLCRGIVTGTTLPSQPGEYIWAKDGEIVRCPWHGWEFDITTGQSIFNPHKMRVKKYTVTVEPVGPAVIAAEEDERIETFPVTVEDGWVILHA